MNTNEDLNQAYWEERYHNHQTAWDIGAISPPMKSAIDQLAFQYPYKKDLNILKDSFVNIKILVCLKNAYY